MADHDRRVSRALPASVWMSRYARVPALTSGPTAPASLPLGIGIPSKTKDADTILASSNVEHLSDGPLSCRASVRHGESCLGAHLGDGPPDNKGYQRSVTETPILLFIWGNARYQSVHLGCAKGGTA